MIPHRIPKLKHGEKGHCNLWHFHCSALFVRSSASPFVGSANKIQVRLYVPFLRLFYKTQQQVGLGFLSGFVCRVSRFGSTSCLHRSLAALPDRHCVRPESPQLVANQLEPLDSDVVWSYIANQKLVLGIYPMGFAGDMPSSRTSCHCCCLVLPDILSCAFLLVRDCGLVPLGYVRVR